MVIKRLRKMKSVKVASNIACFFLFNVLFITNQSIFAQDLRPTGLLTLHENIPGIKAAPKLFTANTLPPSVDISSQFPPVGDQGALGSCVAFATGYAYKTYQEGHDWNWDISTNRNIFSPAYLYSQIHWDNSADGGGTYFERAFNVLQNQGCTTLDDMPYDGSSYGWQTLPTDQQRTNAANHKALNWSQLANGDYQEIKANIARGNPVAIGIPVHSDFDNLNSNDSIYDIISGNLRGYHALCVVGYDDNIGAIKILNSWGTGWGLNGYGWISYNLVEKEQISAYVMTDNIDAIITDDFNAPFYLSQYSDLQNAFSKDYSSALNHWHTYGINEGRRSSPEFDVSFYVNYYPDLKAAFGTDYNAARNHWLTYGINEGRRGSPEFDVSFYVNYYPDLKAAFGTDYKAAMNHWRTFGKKEGRRSSQEFDVSFYVNYYPDLKAAFGTNYKAAIDHWFTYGIHEGRRSSPEFDVSFYVNYYSDLAAAFGTNYKAAMNHWFTYGLNEGRRSSSEFDVSLYVNFYPDLTAAFGTDYKSAFNHWFVYGKNEGRRSI